MLGQSTAAARLILMLVAAEGLFRPVLPPNQGPTAAAPVTFSDEGGDDMAIVWIDSHPDIGTPASQGRGVTVSVAGLLCHRDNG